MKRLFSKKRNLATLAFVFAALAAAAFCFVSKTSIIEKAAAQTESDEIVSAIENALYTRAEFFGAKAIVPFPTVEARKNLAVLAEKYPNEAQIFLKLSELDEQLGDYEKAEEEINRFVQLNSESEKSLEILAAFYGRRAEFERQAATLERILRKSAGDKRAPVFARIIELARRHKLESYLQADFYREIVAGDATAFAVVEQFIGKLIEDKDYSQALQTVRQTREKFPERSAGLFEKEIEILLADSRATEAEAVYHRAFDPFWDEEQAEKYYQFLNEQNRFRAYKNELRARFKKNPADFDAAIRLFHFEKNDYAGDPPGAILLKLETARAERKINWQPEELLTISRLLLAADEGEAASRFLYTLFAQNKLEKGGELRAKVLYQLFEMLSDAGGERLAITNGNLDFYRDVAASDPHPGIATGILSLIFSDTNPAKELDEKEQTATKLFNRAAAYRIFETYKEENPASPQLAQMYLDIVRLYTANGETEIAARVLTEFEAAKKFENSPDYPVIALKLADAFITAKQFEKERAVYQKLLDYLGEKQTENNQPLVPVSGDAEPTQTKPALDNYPPQSNQGINFSSGNSQSYDYSYYKPLKYRDFLTAPKENVTYAEILNRFVASLDREQRTTEILGLYAAESAKYPAEAGLDEQMLQWLGQTNLTEEQLKVYQTAIKKFPDRVWQDRLARWFLRRERKADFERFSIELVENFGDAETQNFLAQFINRNVASKPETFDARLYLALYTKAHQRFPHNLNFVKGLLDYYAAHKQDSDWRQLAAEYYFESSEIRNLFLSEFAKNGKLRDWQIAANAKIETAPDEFKTLPYKLFRADTAARLSNYEEAVDAYRELNRLYPNTPEYAERLIALTRSLGQINRVFLTEAAIQAHSRVENSPFRSEYRTRAGELQAELGDYEKARAEWQKLIETARGEQETYLETATVFWDYFQYDDALKTIQNLRAEKRDENIYAFESGAIFEAKKDLPAALREYVKALDGSIIAAENAPSSDRAKRRLAKLYLRRGVPQQLQTAFDNERKKLADAPKISGLVLGYADFLRRVRKWDEGKQILRIEAAKNNSPEFLEEARDLCASAEDRESEQFVLRRLAESAQNTRSSIKFNLQLAESLSDEGKNVEASKILNRLVVKFPTNYGVLSETADFFWRIGERENSLGVLQTAMRRGRGSYRKTFGRKLAARFLEQNRPAPAETVLRELYAEDALDYGVFQELTKIYVRIGQREKLEQIFSRTLSEIKRQNIDFREINDQIASLRRSVINAYTRLKDYRAALAQHIEIINREPENEETTEAAIDYVGRYGGGENLVDYYQKTAGAAYKNYRWFIVLARIYEASKDYETAAENYRIAIQNQPEMLDLYDALAAVYEKQGNLNRAIETVSKTLELSNDEPQRLQRLIKLLEKAGRRAEAEIVSQKLPVAEKPKQTLAERFAEAEQLKITEKAKALEIYRTAFEAFTAAPLAHELKTAEIVGYVNALRGVEPLDRTSNKLWDLRDKLVAESEKSSSINVGRARAQRQILDGAMAEAFGSAAREFASGNERQAISNDLIKRLENAVHGANETIALLRNLSRRAGFGLLEEEILVSQKDHSFVLKNIENYHAALNSLVAFYRERGDFTAILNLLEIERARDFAPEKYDYLRQIAENARLVGDREKELAVLREYFQSKCRNCSATEDDDLAARYFEALAENGASGKAELIELTENPSAFQLQFINFLLKIGERELAHAAIENSKFPTAWKQSRHAQTSVAFDEFADENADYFRAALQLKSIGELIGENPQPDKQLVGDDWFRLANVYGRWLAKAKKENADQFLPALVEQRPQDANQQTWLSIWYLNQKDAARAIEHSQIALEMNANDKNAPANLGAAYFLAGDEQKAFETWSRIISGEKPDFEFYLQTLVKHGRAAQARDALAPILIERLKNPIFDESETKKEIRLLANSFGDNKNSEIAAAQAAFLRKIAESVPENILVPKSIVSESLVAKTQLAPFYELLIKNSPHPNEFDYNYTELLETNLSEDEAEAALDVRENYEPEEPENEQIKWQREYLNHLLDERQNEKARKLIGEIEKSIAESYARPQWLRLAKLHLDLQTNAATQTILPDFKKFVGINPNAEKIIAPSLERLNDAINLLRAENQESAADELQTAVYARLLALEKFEKTTFAALASLTFKRGDAALGLKLLQTMVDLTDDEKKHRAARELAELDLIKTGALDATKIGEAEPENTLESSEALRLAAETAARFEQMDAALEFRRQLLVSAPESAENRLELAKLFARKQNFAEAANHLAAAMKGAEFSRKAQWRAVWTTVEICGGNAEAWNALKNQLPDLQTSDGEIPLALAALELWKTNSANAARNLLESSQIQTANLQFLNGLIAKENGQTEAAINKILAAIKSDQKAELAFAINSAENEMLRQVIALYAANEKPHAALKLAENALDLNDRNLLELLSKTAEQIGDFKRAAEFESARKSLLTDDGERLAAEKRLEFLRQCEQENENSAATVFRVDRRNFSE